MAEVDGLQLWHTGVPVGYWNAAHVTAVPADPERALAQVPGWFAARELPYGVLVPVELEPAVAGGSGGGGRRERRRWPAGAGCNWRPSNGA